ncbi:hypothetical protein QIS74_07404 [Colletotrichum tabaci]|uniref:Uncharacterized protein n=1 Tax=Colletotrichum tabaci TaxID=1209068 RepID=A0AAV9TC80_9PEZI
MPPKKRTTVAAAAAVPLGEADANRGSATNNTTAEPAEKPALKSRKLVRAAYPSGSTHKIAYNSLSDFLKKKGPTSGNTSSVFYAQMASYIVPTYARLTMDQYGKVHCY